VDTADIFTHVLDGCENEKRKIRKVIFNMTDEFDRLLKISIIVLVVLASYVFVFSVGVTIRHNKNAEKYATLQRAFTECVAVLSGVKK
jgi:flagellar basal body-associated protein FliL